MSPTNLNRPITEKGCIYNLSLCVCVCVGGGGGGGGGTGGWAFSKI